MRDRQNGFRRGQQVVYAFEVVVVEDVIVYPAQIDLVIRLGNGMLVQVEDWKVEKI